MFAASVYIERRNVLKQAVRQGIILLLGNEECGMNYASNCYPFRQDSTFLYYFGIDIPGLAAVIDIDHDQEIVFGDDVSLEDAVWTGKLPPLQTLAESVGVQATRRCSDLQSWIDQAVSSHRRIHFLPPYRSEHRLKISRLLHVAIEEQPQTTSLELRKGIIHQRLFKSDEELELIRRAVQVSNTMHETVLRHARPGMKEFELAAMVEYEARKAGCSLSFPTICTVHGEILHNTCQTHTLQSGQLLLLDAGAETPEHYCGDLSTTLPVDRHFTTRQKIIYRISEQMHDAAVATLKPGNTFKDIYCNASYVLIEQMQAIGLMQGDIHDALHQGAHALFMPHGTGHPLGLDVHDMENLGEYLADYDQRIPCPPSGIKYMRLTHPLSPRLVLTVEPGIYFIPDLIEQWEREGRFRQFIRYDEVRKFIGFGGIRNEENYVITGTGACRLGSYLPRRVEEVEAFRS